MRKKTKNLLTAAMAMVILLNNGSMVKANELKTSDVTAYEQETDAVTRAAKKFSFGRNKSTYTLGTMSISSSSHFTIIMPNNNNKDLVQGTVYFIPMSGGRSINYIYGNYVLEEYSLDLSNLPNDIYMVKIDGAAVGTSHSATVTVNY